jgi:hypothetical protein
MADLGQLLGTLLASLAHARRIADEETAMIAEHYKDHPLLEGMSLPRIRVPEMVLEVPMLISSQDAGEASEPQETHEIVNRLVDKLTEVAAREKIKISAKAMEYFKADLSREINRLRPNSVAVNFSREVVVRAVDTAFAQLVKRETSQVRAFIRADQHKRISADLRHRASEVALKKIGKPPTIEASIITSEVKEGAGVGTVSRVKLVMKEEGLEWTITEAEDGTHTKTLTPE